MTGVGEVAWKVFVLESQLLIFGSLCFRSCCKRLLIDATAARNPTLPGAVKLLLLILEGSRNTSRSLRVRFLVVVVRG